MKLMLAPQSCSAYRTSPPAGAIGVVAVLTLSALLATAGCGNDGPPTAKVSGTVTLDGDPLPFGSVVFSPPDGRAASGAIQSDGSFTLGTFTDGDGAVLGRHQVAVIARKKLDDSSPGAPMAPRFGPSLIPELYSDSATSGLSFEVTAEGDNVYSIELSSQANPPR